MIWIDDFPVFFEELHGYKAFPWQIRLAEEVCSSKWPENIGLPTAAGKTACMDMAVFALAFQAGSGARNAPRRIFFVIDRRVVVDEAYLRARRIAEKLRAALSGPATVLREVAERLVALGGEPGYPLQVAVLRGGMYRDQRWPANPAQPLVVVSTVDQVGSRLLFRGYGVTSRMQPIHAGLVGNDTLIFLDEAHLSRPFEQTLASLGRYRGWASKPIPTPWQVVRMTATPATDGDVFRESEHDLVHPVLGKRLSASKVAKLKLVDCESVKKDARPLDRRRLEEENRAKLVREILEQAQQLAGQDGVRLVGVVVNRVATARATFEGFCQQGCEAILFTGRCRPHDRDRLFERILPRVEAGRSRAGGPEGTLFVVATQCIEVGANLDFDALVTEAASLDALRQRFGRLDRLGDLRSSSAVIVARADQVGKNADDPVYGQALKRTWDFLISSGGKPRKKSGTRSGQQLPSVDFGFRAMEGLLPAYYELVPMLAPACHSPVILPGHLDLWVQTSPIPAVDPDPAYWLHAPESGPADCSVVWRADLDANRPEQWSDIVSLCPPCSSEAIPIPLYVLREWLSGAPRDFSDIEGEVEAIENVYSQRYARRALRWLGPDDSEIINGDQIRPGDTVVVPSAYGGSDEFGWNPECRASVQDIGDPVSLRQRGRPILRLHPAVIENVMFAEEERSGTLRQMIRHAIDAEDTLEATQTVSLILRILSADETCPSWVHDAVGDLSADRRRRVIVYPDRSGIVVVGERKRTNASVESGTDFSTEDDTSVCTRAVTLREHSEGVAKRARGFAEACGMPADICEDIVLAAQLHDLGKAYFRFQTVLHGGDEVGAALAEEPLAKSNLSDRDMPSRIAAYKRAGLDRGWRHEVQSLALAQGSNDILQGAHDPDLVLHLVASHHGRCRPFALAAVIPPAEKVSLTIDSVSLEAPTHHGMDRLDSGVCDRFWELVRKYGWHGLAYLETVLRLADHRRSEEEAGKGAPQ